MRACGVALACLLFGVLLPARQGPGAPRASLGSGTYFDVRAYGAKGDGAAKDTAAVQAAMDAAAKQGGGTVLVPAGKYLCGTIHLRSNVTLYLEAGATLLESTDNADFDPYEKLDYPLHEDRETTYFHYALLAGEKVEHIAIVGQGVIDGNRPGRGGPKPIALKLCRFVAIRGITIRQAPNYCISLLGTDYVDIDGVTMVDDYADGIDPDSSRSIRISNCYFDGWDDAIVAKASLALGYKRSTENLTVTNCVLTTNSCYLKFGSESSGDFKNVAFTNTVCYRRPGADPRNLAVVSLESHDGANIDGVVISNIVARDVYKPFAITLNTRSHGGFPPVPPGTIRNVAISNFIATGASVAAQITGIPERLIQGVTLKNVTITVRRPRETESEMERFAGGSYRPKPAYGLVAQHVGDLQMANVQMRWQEEDERPAIILDDVRSSALEGFRTDTVAGAGPLLWFRDTVDFLLQGCHLPPNTPLVLRLSGARTSGIHLAGNDFTHAVRVVESDLDVPAAAIIETGNLQNSRAKSFDGRR